MESMPSGGFARDSLTFQLNVLRDPGHRCTMWALLQNPLCASMHLKVAFLNSKASTLADFCFLSFFCSSFGILLFMPSQDKVEQGEKNTEILKMVQVSLKNEVEEFALMTFCKKRQWWRQPIFHPGCQVDEWERQGPQYSVVNGLSLHGQWWRRGLLNRWHQDHSFADERKWNLAPIKQKTQAWNM